MLAIICLLFVHPDHLCFDRTTYDNINGPGGPLVFDIIGPAGPLMYPDQIFRDRTLWDQIFWYKSTVVGWLPSIRDKIVLPIKEHRPS